MGVCLCEAALCFCGGVWFCSLIYFFVGLCWAFYGFCVEGLILAQDERWRRA